MVLGCFVFNAGVAGAVTKKAAPAECKVESVEGAKVILNCAEAGKELAAGATVTLKMKKAAIAAEKPAVAPAKAEPAKAAESAKPAATAPVKPAEPATPAAPAKPASKKKIEGC